MSYGGGAGARGTYGGGANAARYAAAYGGGMDGDAAGPAPPSVFVFTTVANQWTWRAGMGQTLDGASRATQWVDQINGEVWAERAAGQGPLFTAADAFLSGAPTLVFNGSSNGMNGGFAGTHPTALPFCWLWVFRFFLTTSATPSPYLMRQQAGGNTYLFTQSGSLVSAHPFNTTVGFPLGGLGGWTTATWVYIGKGVNGGGSGAFYNGGAFDLVSANAGQTPNAGPYYLAWDGTGNWASMHLNELTVLEGEPSLAERYAWMADVQSRTGIAYT